jgi:hypothetical protein
MGKKARHRHRYNQPGKPQQTADNERYNCVVRHEWLDQNIVEPREEAQAIQHDSLNMAIGGIKLADKNKNNRMISTVETQ